MIFCANFYDNVKEWKILQNAIIFFSQLMFIFPHTPCQFLSILWDNWEFLRQKKHCMSNSLSQHQLIFFIPLSLRQMGQIMITFMTQMLGSAVVFPSSLPVGWLLSPLYGRCPERDHQRYQVHLLPRFTCHWITWLPSANLHL